MLERYDTTASSSHCSTETGGEAVVGEVTVAAMPCVCYWKLDVQAASIIEMDKEAVDRLGRKKDD